MKPRFFIPLFALCFFILSCSGDDPDEFFPNDDDSIYGTQDDDNNLPDAEQSENGEKNDSENSDTEADTGDDSGTNGDSDNTTTDNETNSDDDTETTPDNDNDTTPDDDTDTTPDDADSTDDSGDPQTDDDADSDADSDTVDNDADTESGDDDTDSGSETGDEELEIVLPYNGGTVDKTMNFGTEIKKIDVLLMVERYSSMSAAHDNLKANVKTAIIDGIRAKIPDSAFGLVTLGVVEAGNAYDLAQPITKDTNSIRNAVDEITKITSGRRTYHGLALWEAASGEADREYLILCDSTAVCNPPDYKTINISPVDCSGQIGNIGGACFRDNAMPIFVMASSQNFNNFTRKKFNDDYYDEWRESVNGNTYTLEKTAVKAAAKMNEINAKFIGVSYKTTNPANGFKSVAGNTLSQDTANPANNFNISVEAGDETFSAQIAEAVKNLTENIKLDVQAQFKHVDNGYGVENTVQFKKSIYPEAGKTVKAGDTASFDITFENTIHENNDCEPHIFYITVEAAGEGLVLDSRSIKVVVPGKEEGCDSL